MYVTVVGGGNSTPIFAVLSKMAGHKVAILTRRPADWNAKDIGFVNDDPGYCDGEVDVRREIDLVTADPAECIPQSDMIFLAGIPIHHNPEVSQITGVQRPATSRLAASSPHCLAGSRFVS
jgi:hypothetical protein